MSRPCAPCGRKADGRGGKIRSRPNKKMDFGLLVDRSLVHLLRWNSWRGTLSRVFFTPYAPSVHTPAAPASTNTLIGYAKTTTRAVYGAFTAEQAPARHSSTNHGVTLSPVRIRPAHTHLLPISGDQPRANSHSRCLRSTASPGMAADWFTACNAAVTLLAARVSCASSFAKAPCRIAVAAAA